MNFPENLKYTKDHEWLRIDGSTGYIGVTDYAQGELGDVVFVDITKTGQIKQHDVFGTVEAVKTVSDLYAPVAGTVVEINPKLTDSPELINKDPYGDGWMIKITLANPTDANALMDAAAYKALIGK